MNLGGKGGQGRVRAEGELDKEGRGEKKTSQGVRSQV